MTQDNPVTRSRPFLMSIHDVALVAAPTGTATQASARKPCGTP